MFEQLPIEHYIAEAGVSSIGGVDNVLRRQVFQQWIESMICCGNRCLGNGKSWCYVAETGVSATGKIGVTLLKQEF